MSEVTTTTTSVNYLPEDIRYASGTAPNTFTPDENGAVDVSRLVQAVRAYETGGESLTYEETDEIEPMTAEDEAFLERRYSSRTHRALGRIGLGRFAKKVDRFLTLATTHVESTKDDWDNANAFYADKYMNKRGDGFFMRGWNAIRRNQLKVKAYGIGGTLGALALSRGAPYIAEVAQDAANAVADTARHAADNVSDTATDVYNAVVGPREVTVGGGGQYDLAANSIVTTPMEHEMTPDQPIVLAMGGHTQGDAGGSGYVASLENARIIEPGQEVREVDWSAQMGLPGETIDMKTSDAEGAARLKDAIADAGGSPVRVLSFSQGTQATLRALNDIAAQNGGRLPDNLEVVLIGGPSGERGMSNNNVVGMVNPLLHALNFEIDQPIPPGGKITVVTHINDVFGNSAGQSGAFTGVMALAPSHVVDGEILYTYTENNITYVVKGRADGLNHPLSDIARAHGVPVNPELDNFFNKAVPRTELGEPIRYTNVAEATDALEAYAETQTGHTGMASGAINAAMNPERTHDLQTITDLQKIPDQIAEMTQNPASIPKNLNDIHNQAANALQTFGKWVNPHQWIDAGVDAARGAGVPLPDYQIPAPAPAAPAPAWNPPAWTPPVPEFAPAPPNPFVPPAPAPAPVFAPAPAPAPAPIFETPSAPATPFAQPNSGYAPVGPLFSNPAPTGYAPVGPLFS